MPRDLYKQLTSDTSLDTSIMLQALRLSDNTPAALLRSYHLALLANSAQLHNLRISHFQAVALVVTMLATIPPDTRTY